jgi:hypothetical protein
MAAYGSTGNNTESKGNTLQRPLGLGLEIRTNYNRMRNVFGGTRPRSIFMEAEQANTTERSFGMPLLSNDDIFVFISNPAGIQLQVSSSSTNDTSAGTGARTINVDGLDHTWNPISETITLNGQNPVNTTDTNWLRINKIWVETAGSGGVNEGDLYVSPQGQSLTLGVPSGNTHAAVINTFNNSTMGIFSVRKGFYFEYLRASNYTTARDSRPLIVHETGWFNFGGSSDPSTFLNYNVGFLGIVGSSSFNFDGSIGYPEYSDLDLRVATESGTTSAATIYYQFQLVKLDYINGV